MTQGFSGGEIAQNWSIAEALEWINFFNENHFGC